MKPETWALAPAESQPSLASLQPDGSIAYTSDANAWLDTWIIAQAKVAEHLSLVAHDPLAPPVDADAQIFDAPGRWDTRGADSYLVLSKDKLAPGAVRAATHLMLGDQYVLFIIEDDWPFDQARPPRQPRLQRSARDRADHRRRELRDRVGRLNASLPALHPA
jgi:hypothetical protein